MPPPPWPDPGIGCEAEVMVQRGLAPSADVLGISGPAAGLVDRWPDRGQDHRRCFPPPASGHLQPGWFVAPIRRGAMGSRLPRRGRQMGRTILNLPSIRADRLVPPGLVRAFHFGSRSHKATLSRPHRSVPVRVVIVEAVALTVVGVFATLRRSSHKTTSFPPEHAAALGIRRASSP